MRFSTIALIVCATASNAATIPNMNIARDSVTSNEAHFSGTKDANGTLVARDNTLHKRVIVETILGTIGTTVLTQLTTAAVNAATKQIENIANFDSAREVFTQATVLSMFNANTDTVNFPAAACYNKGYRLENPAGFTGLVSLTLKSGVLHTDYDCMYVSKANAFFTDSDGGFINLAYQFTSDCTFDQSTGDLRCK